MDRAAFIEDNRAILTRIVAALIAMTGFATSGQAAKLPQSVVRAVWRVLYPAESAVRRLIVIAARGLTVKLSPTWPKPKGNVRGKGGGGERLSFQLFDSRKRFSPRRPAFAARPVPRVHCFGVSPLVPLFQLRPVESPVPAPAPDGDVDALPLGRRLAAIKLALENLPRQAKRLVRWQARRDRMQRPTFKTPLRPGPPPGHRREPEQEIDLVLERCHFLAWEALNNDTS
ncbi:hypothetical protein BH10PSE7_BH10PSE7_29930 [soil metagenome]